MYPDEVVSDLKRELADANELYEAMREKSAAAVSEEAIAAMSPAAARASALLKSGMTLTQVHTTYS